MYGKVFEQIYEGTLATKGPWQALVTFQQFIVLADSDGVVDMTPEALARRTTLPLEIIKIGIAELEAPDPDSRSPDHEGRRLLRLSDTRSWGWRITNYLKYRTMQREQERREYHRQYWHEKRSPRAKAASADPRPEPVASPELGRALKALLPNGTQQDSTTTTNSISRSISNTPPLPPAGGVETTKAGRPKRPKPAEPPGFTRFWDAWPEHTRKAARRQCAAKWETRELEMHLERILRALEAAKTSQDWRKGAPPGEFIPAPLVWLNQDRFDAPTEAQANPWEWTKTATGIIAHGKALGFGEWSEDAWAKRLMPNFPTYRDRIYEREGVPKEFR